MADGEEGVEEEQLAERAAPTSETETETKAVVEQTLAPPKYEVRPTLGDKFQAAAVQDIILSSMQEQLTGRQYRADQAPRWAKTISNGVRQRVQDLGMKRYKIIVLTSLIEMKGAGVKVAQRCIWDPETDAYIDDSYRNDTIMCHTVVYGVYMY